jgi:hypothetical protein
MSKLAVPGKLAKRHSVPEAHWVGSLVPLVLQHTSAHVVPSQSPERQSRPVPQMDPPAPSPSVAERESHPGATQ